jgi:RinA family phage transcriptional activator
MIVRINKSIFRYIEHELYNYEQTKKDLQLYREQVLEGTASPEVSVQNSPGDVTANKVIKLTSSAFVVRAERVINAIEKSLDILGDRHKELFKLKYQIGVTWPNITIDMGISDRTYYRLRRELVITVGQHLGLINVE